MLKYLTVILDDTSVSFCHYANRTKPKLIDIEVLKSAIIFAMKHRLSVQVLYPPYQLPSEYESLLQQTSFIRYVAPNFHMSEDDIIVCESIEAALRIASDCAVCIVKTDKLTLFESASVVPELWLHASRVNLVITDCDTMSDDELIRYKDILEFWAEQMAQLYAKRIMPQFNVLTDRILLQDMNNCNAGFESIAVAPDGFFYLCPAFYYEGMSHIGSIFDGVQIRNPQLYKRENAPICCVCDAYQCKRCVYRNVKRTLEVNTPGRVQCVMSHIERNASKLLHDRLVNIGIHTHISKIPTIEYIDPLDKIIRV